MSAPTGDHLIFFDGTCGLCNRSIRFVLKRDRRHRFVYAALQGETARELLPRHGGRPEALETFYVLADWREATPRLFARSDAALFCLRELGGAWAIVALARIVPRALRDWVYERVAANRYRWFGRYDACPMPSKAELERFVEVP